MTVGKCSWLSCTMRSPVDSMPTTCAVGLDHRCAVDRPVDHRLHRLSARCRPALKASTSVVMTSETGVSRGMSVLRELGQRGREAVDEVAGHEAAAPG